MPQGEVIGVLKVHIQNTNDYLWTWMCEEEMRGDFVALEFFIDSDRILTNWEFMMYHMLMQLSFCCQTTRRKIKCGNQYALHFWFEKIHHIKEFMYQYIIFLNKFTIKTEKIIYIYLDYKVSINFWVET